MFIGKCLCWTMGCVSSLFLWQRLYSGLTFTQDTVPLAWTGHPLGPGPHAGSGLQYREGRDWARSWSSVGLSVQNFFMGNNPHHQPPVEPTLFLGPHRPINSFLRPSSSHWASLPCSRVPPKQAKTAWCLSLLGFHPERAGNGVSEHKGPLGQAVRSEVGNAMFSMKGSCNPLTGPGKSPSQPFSGM